MVFESSKTYYECLTITKPWNIVYFEYSVGNDYPEEKDDLSPLHFWEMLQNKSKNNKRYNCMQLYVVYSDDKQTKIHNLSACQTKLT